MSMERDLVRFAERLEERARGAFLGGVSGAKESVVTGSAVTGAPGQPVDTGNLRASWQQSFPEDWLGRISTNVEYAPAIEEGQQEPYELPDGRTVTPQPMTLRSAVGGFHSVKLTRAGWQAIADQAVREAVQGASE